MAISHTNAAALAAIARGIFTVAVMVTFNHVAPDAGAHELLKAGRVAFRLAWLAEVRITKKISDYRARSQAAHRADTQ